MDYVVVLLSSLRAGIASPSCQKGQACRSQATDERSRSQEPMFHFLLPTSRRLYFGCAMMVWRT